MSLSRTFFVAACLTAVAMPALAAQENWAGKHASSPILYENPGSALWWERYNTTVTNAVAIVYKNASSIGLYKAADDDYVTAVNNLESEFTFTYDFAGICGIGPAGGCTIPSWDGTTYRTETDVFMDGNLAWDTSLTSSQITSYGGSGRPLATTLIHEFGHALGLGHENRYYNIMGKDWTHLVANGTGYTTAMGEDATYGLRNMYGSTTGGYEDLSVSHWKWDEKTTGEYSNHIRNEVQDSAGTELAKTTVSEQPIYTITKGAKGKVEVTVENSGAFTQVTNLRLYLSSNSTISSADTTLLTQSISMGQYLPSEGTYEVTWPSTLSSGATWYVGACVDSSSTLTEVREDNNCAHISQLKVK